MLYVYRQELRDHSRRLLRRPSVLLWSLTGDTSLLNGFKIVRRKRETGWPEVDPPIFARTIMTRVHNNITLYNVRVSLLRFPRRVFSLLGDRSKYSNDKKKKSIIFQSNLRIINIYIYILGSANKNVNSIVLTRRKLLLYDESAPRFIAMSGPRVCIIIALRSQ